MQDYNTIIGAIQMRLNKCPTRSVMDRFRIGSSTLNLIMSRYKALELTIDELEAMSPKKVEMCIRDRDFTQWSIDSVGHMRILSMR